MAEGLQPLEVGLFRRDGCRTGNPKAPARQALHFKRKLQTLYTEP